jgi:hypothetical protein
MLPRGYASLSGSGGPLCTPQVYVDGVPIEESLDDARMPSGSRGVPIDWHVPAHALRAVEVYLNPSQAPPQFQKPFASACGVVVMWTDYGFGIGYTRSAESGS